MCPVKPDTPPRWWLARLRRAGLVGKRSSTGYAVYDLGPDYAVRIIRTIKGSGCIFRKRKISTPTSSPLTALRDAKKRGTAASPTVPLFNYWHDLIEVEIHIMIRLVVSTSRPCNEKIPRGFVLLDQLKWNTTRRKVLGKSKPCIHSLTHSVERG